MTLREANFDGIVGPTHNYAGLSHGNVASASNRGEVSRPREAALQGLAKAKYLASLGLVQGVLPPQERPHLPTLRRLGFRGTDEQILAEVALDHPVLLAQCCSASSMWAANAATMAPCPDTEDGRAHFTAANLRATFHRSLESVATAEVLRRIFPEGERFAHHDPLPGGAHLGDEGAANHTRLSRADDDGHGAHLFVYGRTAFDATGRRPARYPARQTLEASAAIARLHRLAPERTLFAQQNPHAIDQGVFHNDVIAVGHRHVLLYHEHAFAETGTVLDRLDAMLGGTLSPVVVRDEEADVREVVGSYLFNSQLLTLPEGDIVLVAPTEARDSERTRGVLDRIVAEENPISAVHYLDVRQSMRNGGGPACLRLRVQLSPEDLAAVHPPCLLDDTLYDRLVQWVGRHYREELQPGDLADPQLLRESREALDQLTKILQLGSLYPFQQI